jgi:hypothetical protein
MAVEFLVRLTSVTAHADVGTHRLRGSIVSVKPYPNNGWGNAEGPPSYGVLRVTSANYKNFQTANTRWRRDWALEENTLSVTNTLTVTESTPTLKMPRITPGELAGCFDSKLHDATNITIQGNSIVLSFEPKTSKAMVTLQRRVADIMNERIQRRRYYIPEAVVAQLEANNGFLELSTQSVIDISDDSLKTKV